uniref:Uncharacterized protein n=1 Tax=Anguilla anguilla TaxID=7936 RepID=A0A0E9TTZ3_ANGAN
MFVLPCCFWPWLAFVGGLGQGTP